MGMFWSSAIHVSWKFDKLDRTSDCEIQTLPWKMSQPRNIFEALDNPFWLCSGGLRMFSTLSISKQKGSVLHQRPHKQIRKSQSIVKRQLIKYSMLTQFLTIRQIAQSSVALIDANVKFTSSLEKDLSVVISY